MDKEQILPHQTVSEPNAVNRQPGFPSMRERDAIVGQWLATLRLRSKPSAPGLAMICWRMTMHISKEGDPYPSLVSATRVQG